MKTNVATVIFLTLILSCATMVGAQEAETDYKEYRRPETYRELFNITFNKKHFSVIADEYRQTYPNSSVEVTPGLVTAEGTVIFDSLGAVLGNRRIAYDEIIDLRILSVDEDVTISFLTRDDGSRRVDRLKAGNRMTSTGAIIIEEEEFLRGIVLCIGGEVEIYGEVNKDIVCLFGNIYIGPAAVARGDVATVTGRVDVARDASVYGEIYSTHRRDRGRSHRYYRSPDWITSELLLEYNRVDGLLLGGGVGFIDADSLLPRPWGRLAYAFASKRWRYDVGLEQTILRGPSLTVGARYYRWLQSEDDWMITDDENTAFALIATEDFKDYYEAEGGQARVSAQPRRQLKLEAGYTLEETKWLEADNNLWSLFGGGKEFCDNFTTVDDAYRLQGIDQLDDSTNAFFSASIDWDTRERFESRFESSSWHFTGALEWSSTDFSSDFDYRRYTLSLRRYQQLHDRSMLLLRAMYGGSDGYLPMHKRFFLGGLGTLRGYDHKEYMGSRFWMTNAEYRLRFPKVDMAASIFWDAGAIANDEKLDGDIEVKHCIGIGLSFGDEVRINVSRRLDRSYDNDPKIYVRLRHMF